ncbi:hypothetical protein J6590_053886 [Homalodisca vitripennis]|nr:hypothetical protein J6590_053886 [Homalodisca vitripennis]
MGATQDSLRYTVTTTRRGAHFAHCVDDKGRWSLQARIPINTTERHKRCHEERMMSPEHCFHSYTSHLHFIVIHRLSTFCNRGQLSLERAVDRLTGVSVHVQRLAAFPANRWTCGAPIVSHVASDFPPSLHQRPSTYCLFITVGQPVVVRTGQRMRCTAPRVFARPENNIASSPRSGMPVAFCRSGGSGIGQRESIKERNDVARRVTGTVQGELILFMHCRVVFERDYRFNYIGDYINVRRDRNIDFDIPSLKQSNIQHGCKNTHTAQLTPPGDNHRPQTQGSLSEECNHRE